MVTPQRSEDRPRKVAELEVDCATAQMQEPVTLTTGDVGSGGLFIQTDAPLEVGDRFGCRFDLGSDEPIFAECEVAWVRTAPDEADPPAGMGVRFVALEPEDVVRLKSWVAGEGNEASPPRVSFQIEGLGRPVPGEFRASSEQGMSAVAELSFLKVGASVQVSVDEGGEGPRFGRIAWLVVEDPEGSEEGASPRVQLGVQFDEEAGFDAAQPTYEPEVPVPLTVRKAPVREMAPSGSLEVPYEDPSLPSGIDGIAGGDSVPATPWSMEETAAPRPRSRRRRVRGHLRTDSGVGRVLGVVREHAARHPRVAMGLAAAAGVLLVAALAAVAFGGSSGQHSARRAKAKRAPVVAQVGMPGAAASAPITGGARGIASSLPAPSAGSPAGPASAPPLPGAPPSGPPSGPAVLRTGPGAHQDPASVLMARPAASRGGLLSDPKKAHSAAKRIPAFRAGRRFIVKLPLEGKPSRVKHYLLANPSGVVVDAVGAKLGVRPGRYKIRDSRINLVKALSRGRSARFIVYYRKGVSVAKFRLEAREDGVRFVLASRPARGKKAARRAKRSARLPRASRRSRRARTASRRSRRARTASRRSRKLHVSQRKQVRRRPVKRRRRPAPVADATED